MSDSIPVACHGIFLWQGGRGGERNRGHLLGTRDNLACILAPAGRPEAALAELRTALQHGLTADLSEHLAEDSDFASLRGQREFRRIVAEAKQRSAKPESTH